MEHWSEIVVFGVVQFFMLVGLVGLAVPIFPGLTVMWLAGLGYGVYQGFDTAGMIIFAVQTVLMLVGSFADNLFMGAGARQRGAAWTSIGLALLAGILGTLLFPPIGGVIAAPLAVLLFEYLRQGDWKKSWEALRGLATGWGLAYFVRLAIGILMMGLWWAWVWITELKV